MTTATWTAPTGHSIHLPAGALGHVTAQALTAAAEAAAAHRQSEQRLHAAQAAALRLGAAAAVSLGDLGAALTLPKSTVARLDKTTAAPWRWPFGKRQPDPDPTPFSDTGSWLSDQVMIRHGLVTEASRGTADNPAREYRIPSGGWILLYSPGRWDQDRGARYILAICPATTPNECATQHEILATWQYEAENLADLARIEGTAYRTLNKIFGTQR